MAGILKFELDRAFKNRRMGGVLLIGLSISLWHLWYTFHCLKVQIWFIGRTLASQAGKAGSTPVICSRNLI